MTDRTAPRRVRTPRKPAKQFKAYNLRIPIDLHEQIEARATADHNPVSATVRRLLSVGLAAGGGEAA